MILYMKKLTLIGLGLLFCLTASAELSEKKMLSDAKAISKVLYSDPDQCKHLDKPMLDIICNGSTAQRRWLVERLLELDINRLSEKNKRQYLSWFLLLIKYQSLDAPYYVQIAGERTRAERERALNEHLLYDFYPNRGLDDRLRQALSLINNMQTFVDMYAEDHQDEFVNNLQQELVTLRTAFMERTFYGTTDYTRAHHLYTMHDAAAQRIASAIGYSAFINDPRLLIPYLNTLGEWYNPVLWERFEDLFCYGYCHLTTEDLSVISTRMRTYANSINRGHELEERAFAAIKTMAPITIQSNASRWTAMQANNDNYEMIMRFVELKQQWENEGREFLQYHPLDCPFELRSDTLYEQYRDLYLRSGFSILREISLTAGGVKAYIHNPTNIQAVKDILSFFGYKTDEVSWDNQLVNFVVDLSRLANDVYYLTNQSWLIGACMEAASVMTQLYDEWSNLYILYTLADMMPLFESTGNKDFVKNLLETYGVPALELYPTHNYTNRDLACFDSEICAKMLPYLTIFEDKRYADLAERVKDKLMRHIRKKDCDNTLLMPYVGEYYYQMDSPQTIDLYREYLELTGDTVYAYLSFVGYYVGVTYEYDKAEPYADWLITHYPKILIEAFTYDGLAACEVYAHLGRIQETLTQLQYVEEHLQHDLNVKLLAASDDQSAQIIENYANMDSRFAELLTDTLPDELQHAFAKSFYDWQLLSKGLLLALNKEKETMLLNHPSLYIRQQYQQLQEVQKKLSEQTSMNAVEAQLLQVDRDVAQNNLQQAVQAYIDEHGLEGMNFTQWSQVREALQPNEVAIEFVQGKLHKDTIPTYFALLLRHDSKQPVLIRLFHEDSIQRYIRNKRETQIYNDPEVNKTVANMILKPLQDYIHAGENVYFAATGVLHQIALENMYLNDRQLVSDIYQMRRLSSTRQLVRAQDEQLMEQVDSIVLYGGIRYDVDEAQMAAQSNLYPQQRAYRDVNETDIDRGSVSFLPGTLEEVTRIDTLLSDSRQAHTVLKDLEANEESFKALSGTNTALLHVATHGFFWKKESAMLATYTSGGVSEQQVLRQMDPLRRCGLLLAGANTALSGHAADLPQGVQDGVLTGQEIALLDLNKTRIAILSACKTGVGEVTGDGVFGLQRAFKKAGVETLIMSLWKVNDAATQQLMTEFYYNWITLHQSKREAFRNAQNAVRAVHAEPTYWAGFIMLD